MRRAGGESEAGVCASSRNPTTIAGKRATQAIRAISVSVSDIPDLSSSRSLSHLFRTFEAAT
jgi:hypothetical protein